MAQYIVSFILTLFIEYGIYYLFLKKQPRTLLVYSLVVNAMTLPVATYIYLHVFGNVYIIEVAVCMVESFLLMMLLKIQYTKALAISFAANVATTVVGLVFFV